MRSIGADKYSSFKSDLPNSKPIPDPLLKKLRTVKRYRIEFASEFMQQIVDAEFISMPISSKATLGSCLDTKKKKNDWGKWHQWSLQERCPILSSISANSFVVDSITFIRAFIMDVEKLAAMVLSTEKSVDWVSYLKMVIPLKIGAVNSFERVHPKTSSYHLRYIHTRSDHCFFCCFL